jgi:hypothetical protein
MDVVSCVSYVCAGKTTFLSIASYRDENCPNTITEAFKYVSPLIYNVDLSYVIYGWSDSSCVCLSSTLNSQNLTPTDTATDLLSSSLPPLDLLFEPSNL